MKKKIVIISAASMILSNLMITQNVFADTSSSSQSSPNVTLQSSSSATGSSNASSTSGEAIQKKELTKSYIVYGSGLTQSQRNSIADVLVGNSNPENFTGLVANANDYNQYINNGQPSNTTNAAMISSVAIEPADPGSGIKVDIKDFNGQNNITQVTQQQYAMAAQMAGVTDIMIIVSANRPVSGTSALTGVYEALANDGIQLNNQNTSSANQVLQATQNATQGMNPQDKSKVVQATGQTAQQIAKDNVNGNPDSEQQIIDLLKKNLDKQGVNISGNNINVIADSLNNFKKAPVAQTKQFTKGMDNTLENIKNSINGNMIKAEDWAKDHKGWFERIWNNIKSWFNGLFHHGDTQVEVQNDSSSSLSSTTEN